MGRKTYEMSLNMKGSGGMPPMQEYIFSNSLKEVKKGALLVSGNIKEQIDKIKNENGKDIWLFGGASLTSSLINLGVVDEVLLAVHPVILGGGKPLFPNFDNRIQLTLADSKVYSTGLISSLYTPRGKTP